MKSGLKELPVINETMELCDVIGSIRYEMEKRGISQRGLALMLGESVSNMNRWLNMGTEMPFNVVSRCLGLFGMVLVVKGGDYD